jgi:hypothetical protein
MISRRGLLGGMAGLVAAPAVVKASSLMRISAPPPLVYPLRPLALSFAVTSEIFAANNMFQTYQRYSFGYTDARGLWENSGVV